MLERTLAKEIIQKLRETNSYTLVWSQASGENHSFKIGYSTIELYDHTNKRRKPKSNQSF